MFPGPCKFGQQLNEAEHWKVWMATASAGLSQGVGGSEDATLVFRKWPKRRQGGGIELGWELSMCGLFCLDYNGVQWG